MRVAAIYTVLCLAWLSCCQVSAQNQLPFFALQTSVGKPVPFADHAVEGFRKRFDPECLQAYGVFIFRVGAGGGIDSVQTAGSLPVEMLHFIRDRILASGSYWRYPAAAGNTKPLILFVFADYYSDRKCGAQPQAGSFAGLPFHLVHLFTNPQQIIETPNGLLLFPAQIGGSRG